VQNPGYPVQGAAYGPGSGWSGPTGLNFTQQGGGVTQGGYNVPQQGPPPGYAQSTRGPQGNGYSSGGNQGASSGQGAPSGNGQGPGGHQGTIRMVTIMMMTHKVGEVIMTGMDIGDKVLVL